MRLKFLLFAVLSAASAILASGCTQTCEIPTARTPLVRVVNSMPDQAAVTILLGGKVVNPAYPYTLPGNFGYVNTYADGTALHTGFRQKLVVLSALKDTLIDTTIALNDHRHTLELLGHQKIPKTTKILLFDDEVQVPDPNENLIRFVDAIPDLPAMDVYFQKDAIGTPALTLFYGDSLGYTTVDSAAGLTITEAGNPQRIIFKLPISLQTTRGFFATIILRGEEAPFNNEPTVETILLNDALPGQSILSVHTFGARFVNATRTQILSLMPWGPLDKGFRVDIAGQYVVMFVSPDSVSDWAPFNPDTHGSGASAVSWCFGIWNGQFVMSLDSFAYKPRPDLRYTMIAIDTAKYNSGQQKIDSMILIDTIPAPPPGVGRLQIVNLSPDHELSFTLGGKNFSMKLRDIDQLDLPPGPTTFAVSDGANKLKDVTIDVPTGRAMSLFFMPQISADALPYRTGPE